MVLSPPPLEPRELTMKPVLQDIFGKVHGNCLAACIASVLEIPLASLPNFIEERDWRAAVNRFLRPRGLFLLCIHGVDEGDVREALPDGWMLICGRTGPDLWHATVGRKGEIVFDPMGGNDCPFIDDHREYELFVSLDPATAPAPSAPPPAR